MPIDHSAKHEHSHDSGHSYSRPVALDRTAQPDTAFAFAQFHFVPTKQSLLQDGKPVRLGSRAMDILAVLVERPGEVISKEEILTRVWPDTFVEASNLKVNVAALRRALGEKQPGPRYIATASGRGYRFVAPVRRVAAPTWRTGERRLHNLPTAASRVIGRFDTVEAILRLLPQHQLLTIVGPGGIGKTTVAIAAAEAALEQYQDGVWLVDLASLRDPRFIPSTLASALGVAIHAEGFAHSLVAHLRDKRMLLLLDNCEHLIEAAAQTVERIVANAPNVHVLATSREPLRAARERTLRLPPLELPPSHPPLSAAGALAFPAVQLFVERANASLGSFVLKDSDAHAVAEICRRLDGIALAIELAATRMDAFRASELLGLLDDRLSLLKQGRRTALPRHQTLGAALDWSHDLLPEDERLVLARLSIVVGPFTLETAAAVAVDTEIAPAQVVAALANLVSKSLVAMETGGPVTHYRLLETTRVYALKKLSDRKETDAVARRHALHLRDVLERAELELASRPAADWVQHHAFRLDDVRNALEHAFSSRDDDAVAISLTIATVPLWMQLSLVLECQRWVEKALTGEALATSRDEMRLLATLGTTLLYTRGPVPEIKTVLTRALNIARRLSDAGYQLRILWSLAVYQVYAGQCQAALGSLKAYRLVARKSGDLLDQFGCDRLVATAIQYFGEHAEARKRIERILTGFAIPVQKSHVARFQFEQRSTARGTLANILWLQGFPEQAAAMARSAVDDARAADHPLSLCAAHGFTALPLALYAGDIDGAQRALTALQDQLGKHALSVWRVLARCFDGILRDLRGDPTALSILREGIQQLRDAHFRLRYPYYLGALAQALARAGKLENALDAAEEGLDWAQSCGEHWFTPELLRQKGELLRQQGGPRSSAAATACFKRSLVLAHEQGALSWELRSATSFARLLIAARKAQEARLLLAPIYARFSEGLQSVDLVAARTLLEKTAR